MLLWLLISCKEKAQLIWNIPPLVGESIDVVFKTLGEPDEKRYLPNRAVKIYYEYVYRKDGKTLSVNFNPYTRKVNDFTVIYLRGFQTREEMLQIGNLKPSTAKYLAKCKLDFSGGNVYNNIIVYPRK